MRKIIFFTVLIALVLSGCSNMFFDSADLAKEKGLTITVGGGESARTVLPDTPLFTKYELTFVGPGGATRSALTIATGNTAVIDNLTAGEWTITAKGFVKIGGFDVVAATGENTITIIPGTAQNLTINISSVVIDGDDGVFAYDISFPANVTMGELSIFLYGNEPGTPINLKANPAATQVTGSIDLAPGYYLMILTLEDSEGRSAGVAEIVHIYSYMETKKVKAFTTNDFAFKPVGGERFIDFNINNLTVGGDFDDGYIAVYMNSEHSQFIGGGKINGNAWAGTLTDTPANNTVYAVVIASGTDTFYAAKQFTPDLGNKAVTETALNPTTINIDFGTVGQKNMDLEYSFTTVDGAASINTDVAFPIFYLYFTANGIVNERYEPIEFHISYDEKSSTKKSVIPIADLPSIPFPIYYYAYGVYENPTTSIYEYPSKRSVTELTFSDSKWVLNIGDIAKSISGSVSLAAFGITQTDENITIAFFTQDGETLSAVELKSGSFTAFVPSSETSRTTYAQIAVYDKADPYEPKQVVYSANFTIAAGNDEENVGALTFNASHKHPMVTLDLNGGKWQGGGETNLVRLAYADFRIGILPVDNPTKAAHGFTEWNTKQDGTGEEVNEYYPVTADTTVYAKWEFQPVFVTFNLDGGMWRDGTKEPLENVETVEPGVIDPFPIPIRHNYRFNGWKDNESGDTITASYVFSEPYNTVTAQWAYDTTVVVATVTFDGNGGSGRTQLWYSGVTLDLSAPTTSKPFVSDKVQVPSGAELSATLSEGLYRGAVSNMDFDKWTFDEDGLEAVTADADITGDITVYAQWTDPVSTEWVEYKYNVSGMTGTTNVEKAFAYINANAGDYILMVGNDVNYGGFVINNASSVILVGAGSRRTINIESFLYQDNPTYSTLLFVDNVNAKVTLDYNITLKGKNDNINALVFVQSGQLIMNDGAVITDNGSNGVRVARYATFTMNGGMISNNTVTADSGGGVRVLGTFIMNGGTISGNTALQGGGVFNEGTFRMVNGIIYGSNEEGLDEENKDLRNTPSALYNDGGTAQRGTFSGVDGAWEGKGDPLSTTNDTIKIKNGEFDN